MNIQINYDKIEFAVPKIENTLMNTIIPLFNVNPYLTISNKDDINNNKFFYISIYNKYDTQIYIKKPKIFSQVQLNTIHVLSELKDENNKYYYKIPFPKGNYNSLLVQYFSYNTEREIIFNKNTNQYSIIRDTTYLNNLFNIPFEKNDINEYNTYLICKGTANKESYINLITSNDLIFYPRYDSFEFKIVVNQTNNAQKLNISFNSYSYYHGQKPCKYYFIFNNDNDYYSIISGYKQLDSTKKEILLSFENDELEERINLELEISIDLYEDIENRIKIIPVSKENCILQSIESFSFYLKKIKKKRSILP